MNNTNNIIALFEYYIFINVIFSLVMIKNKSINLLSNTLTICKSTLWNIFTKIFSFTEKITYCDFKSNSSLKNNSNTENNITNDTENNIYIDDDYYPIFNLDYNFDDYCNYEYIDYDKYKKYQNNLNYNKSKNNKIIKSINTIDNIDTINIINDEEWGWFVFIE